jgi:hypothetical protein
MRDFRDAKAMALTLREALKAKSVSLTHSESLELVAKTFGLPDWNFLAARIQASQQVADRPSQTAIPPATFRSYRCAISYCFHRWSCRSLSDAIKPGARSSAP